MLRLHTGTDAEGAKAYFDKGLSREDYYTQGREVAGTWHGLGAKLLGLAGEVDRDRFHALCENINPKTGRKLTPRTKSNRRVGFDISFSVPKSVSIHQALTDNQEILGAFQDCVRESMADMEKDARARVRKDGGNASRKTGNLVWAEFVHYTARPVEGRADPHLHAHCFTFNSTWDPVEETWKAAELEEIWKRAPYYQAAFDSRLAEKLQSLGYGIETHETGWELSGYSREMVESFSRRTQLIEAFAKSRGVGDARLKDQFGALTRETKKEGEDKEVQRAEWAARLSPEERARIRALEENRHQPKQATAAKPARTAGQCLDYAARHCFERQSVVPETRLLAEGIQHGIGSVSARAVETELERRKRSGKLLSADLEGEAHLTTPEVLAEEREMLAWARDGRGTSRPLGENKTCRETAFRELTAEGRLPDSRQIAAVEHVLDSPDRVILIRGRAGTGKTTMMRAARDGIREGGKEVFFFAPGAEASRGVLAAEGFDNATTVAKLLRDEALQEAIRGQVVWVDEAGTLGARDTRRLFRLADQAGARVILSGDSAQHAPVARGDALRILEREAGLKPAQLTRIYRQQGAAYREAVEAISSGERRGIAHGFEKLEEMDAIREVSSIERYAALAEAYLDAVLEEKKTALVVSPTHREGAQVTATIRKGLKAAGAIHADERQYTRLRSYGMTEAERSHAGNYRPGLVIQAHDHVPGLKRGRKYEVVAASEHAVRIREAGAETAPAVTLPVAEAARFDVFTKDTVELARGDRIRITKNGMAASRTPAGRKQELRNGAIYEVAGFTDDGDIRAVSRNQKGKVTGEVTIPKYYGNLTHGYCVTSHAAQGKTVDRVFIAQSAQSFRASSREQFYVSVSRGRESVTIYTDDKAQLKARVMESSARTSATELQRSRAHAKAQTMQRHVQWTQRLMNEARSWARAQAARLMQQRAAATRPMRKDRDGPERSL